MTVAGFLTLLWLASGAGQEGDVSQEARLAREAVTASAPFLRVEVIDTRLGKPKGCRLELASVAKAPQGSGVVGLTWSGHDADGAPCSAGGWARVRLFSKAYVATRAVRAEEPLAGAVEVSEREVRAGAAPLTELPAGARAAAMLGKGTVLEARHLRARGLPPGAPVVVVLSLGDLKLEQQGVMVACPGRDCARLPNGHRVEGVLEDGTLKVSP